MAKYRQIAAVRIDWLSENIGFECAVWARKLGSAVALKNLLPALWNNNKTDWAFLLLDCLTMNSKINEIWHLTCSKIGRKYKVIDDIIGPEIISAYKNELRKADELLLQAYINENYSE